MESKHYDAIVIGAGMSGMAAAIRLAMFDKKVLLLEKHSIAGGLNSYYQRKHAESGGVRKFDVGLHALTNYVPKGSKGHPLNKLLKQLRIPYDALKLREQSYSKIHFAGTELKFTNNFEAMLEEVRQVFPHQLDSFLKLVESVKTFNELDLSLEYRSTRQVLSHYLQDPLLIEMVLAPLLIYGSAWEDDMDYGQFVVMFKSIYLEGFARPEGGVRTIIDLLLEKLKNLGADIQFRNPVESIELDGDRVVAVQTKKGRFECNKVFSSIGLPETVKVLQGGDTPHTPRAGQMTFMETILVFDKKPMLSGFDPTIIFYNQTDKYHYRPAQQYYDAESAVFCCPDNYELDQQEGEGIVRITYMANYQQWKDLERAAYLEKKQEVLQSSLSLCSKLMPQFDGQLLFSDVFSPTTIERYTWHQNGAVYGSIDKTRYGKTPYQGLYIIGTDQGFLGIVGSMLSGISMANLYGLMEA
jgi:phytoene dehydrogenase-like protein